MPDPAGVPTGPLCRVARVAGGVEATVDAAWADAAANGHFPDEPLLPGSALLELMVSTARALDQPGRLAAIERAVFRRRVHPRDVLVVRTRSAGAGVVDAVVAANGRAAAEGRLRFETPA